MRMEIVNKKGATIIPTQNVRGSKQVQLLLKWTSTGFEPASLTYKPSVLTIYTNWS